VAELDIKRLLIEKIKDLGGKKILDVRERPAEAEVKGDEGHGLR
jgi:hypothetical protein